jgi:hypothetical protein
MVASPTMPQEGQRHLLAHFPQVQISNISFRQELGLSQQMPDLLKFI